MLFFYLGDIGQEGNENLDKNTKKLREIDREYIESKSTHESGRFDFNTFWTQPKGKVSIKI